MSRIHLLMLSIDESHSRWPGALSLQTGEEKKGTRKTKMSNEERKRPEEEMLTLELLKHRHIAGFLSPPPPPPPFSTGFLVSLLLRSHLPNCGL